jgi:hypothetical protein
VNLLSSSKSQISKAHSMSASCCLIEVEKWSAGEISVPAVVEGDISVPARKQQAVA